MRRICFALLLGGLGLGAATAGEPGTAERGHRALVTRAFTPPPWTPAAYEAAWKLWQPAVKAPPDDYDRAFRDYYGLHPAPYENGRLPMGLRETVTVFNKGLTSDCLLCHGGSILGKSHIGLGNASLDLH